MPSIAQNTGQWAIDQLRRLEAAALARRTEITVNNGRIVEGDRRAQAIADPAVRAAARARYHQLAQEQARIAAAYRTFGAKVAEVAGKVRAWLHANGYSTQLGALGVAPIALPTAIVALLSLGAVVWAANTFLERINNAQGKAVDGANAVVSARLNGQIGHDQMVETLRAQQRLYEATKPKADPLGLANLAEALVPIGIVVVAVILGPPLIRALEGRRSAA